MCEVCSRVIVGGFAALVIGAALAPAVGKSPPRRNPAETGFPASLAERGERRIPVKLTIATDKQDYAPTDKIRIKLTVRNTHKSPLRLTFDTTQRFEIELWRANGPQTDRTGPVISGNGAEKIWTWASGMMFADTVATINLRPGKSLTYAETYSATPTNGSPPRLKPGNYFVTATLTIARRADRPTATTRIAIR